MPDKGKSVSENLETENNDFFDKGEIKHNKFIPLIVIIIVLLVIGFVGCYFYFSNPDRIVEKSINILYDDFSKLFSNNNFSKQVDSVNVDSNFKFNTNLEGFEVLNSQNFNYKIGVDFVNKVMYSDFFWKEDSNNLLGFITYFINDKSFVKFEGNDKVLEIDTNDNSFNFDETFVNNKSLDTEDLKVVSEELKNVLIDSLDTSLTKKSRVSIKVFDEDKSVSKFSYPLTSSNIKSIVSSFVNNVNSNSKLLKKLSDLSGVDVDILKLNFESFKSKDFDDFGEFNVYVNFFNTKIVRVEFADSNFSYGVDFNKDGNRLFISNNSYNFNFDVKSFESDEVSLDFSSNIGVNGDFVFKSKKVNDNMLSYSFDINFKYFMYDFGVNGLYSIEIDSSIPNLDISNSTMLSTLSPSELESISANIIQNIQNSNLFKIFGNIQGDSYI